MFFNIFAAKHDAAVQIDENFMYILCSSSWFNPRVPSINHLIEIDDRAIPTILRFASQNV